MCGRFTLRAPLHQLAGQFLFALHTEDGGPRFNIAPSQAVAAVRIVDVGPRRQLAWLRWGLIPSWTKDRASTSELINARGETVAEKPSFRQAFARRRCLILADGYYEWQKTGGSKKQPYFIRFRDNRPFAFAGLWESWPGDPAKPLETCTIITTTANRLTASLHPRMPVILSEADHDTWLNPQHSDRGVLTGLLRPYDSSALELYPVSTLVNSPRHDSPQCVDPLTASGDEPSQRTFGFHEETGGPH